MTEATQPDRECPVDGCKQRFLQAAAAGRHLMMSHEDARRWASEADISATSYSDGDSRVVHSEQSADAWVESTATAKEMVSLNE